MLISKLTKPSSILKESGHTCFVCNRICKKKQSLNKKKINNVTNRVQDNETCIYKFKLEIGLQGTKRNSNGIKIDY